MIKQTTVETSLILLEALKGANQVGLTFSKGEHPEVMEFFLTTQAATSRVTELLLDLEVSSFWIGTQNKSEDEVHGLLKNLNQRRGFEAVSSSNMTARVYDLSL